MAVQLTGGIEVQLFAGVSLTPLTQEMECRQESLYGVGVSILVTTLSSASLDYSAPSNSQYIPLLVP